MLLYFIYVGEISDAIFNMKLTFAQLTEEEVEGSVVIILAVPKSHSVAKDYRYSTKVIHAHLITVGETNEMNALLKNA